ncbi:MAG: hypothetical protein Q9N62_08570 [Ghiorsea sp.]|nr:hypothetical protein [Ghiorsea sp.]MDQ7058477.1 hypothetical protein [Ghiorsea sp.]
MKNLFFLIISYVFMVWATTSYADTPDCSGVNNWAGTMAFLHLKNAELINNLDIDLTKTKVTLIASEKIDKDLYRQVHTVLFKKKTGEVIKVITINNASNVECSMSGVDVYVISERLGDYR